MIQFYINWYFGVDTFQTKLVRPVFVAIFDTYLRADLLNNGIDFG